MIAPPDLLITVTGKRQPAAQARALEVMGIPYRRRPDGRIIVLVDDLRTPRPDQAAASRPRLRLESLR